MLDYAVLFAMSAQKYEVQTVDPNHYSYSSILLGKYIFSGIIIFFNENVLFYSKERSLHTFVIFGTLYIML